MFYSVRFYTGADVAFLPLWNTLSSLTAGISSVTLFDFFFHQITIITATIAATPTDINTAIRIVLVLFPYPESTVLSSGCIGIKVVAAEIRGLSPSKAKL